AAEINTSFYRPHAAKVWARWAASVPSSFRFAVKMPKLITHERALTRAREPLIQFLGEIAALGLALGPLLVQLPPSLAFDPRHAAGQSSPTRTNDRAHGKRASIPRSSAVRLSINGSIPRPSSWARSDASAVFDRPIEASVSFAQPFASSIRCAPSWTRSRLI